MSETTTPINSTPDFEYGLSMYEPDCSPNETECAGKPVNPNPTADTWSADALAIRARDELRAMLCTMDDFDITISWALCKAIWSRHGADTPIEEFIHSIAMNYLCSLRPGERGVTPEDVADELELFRGNFRDAIAVARRFNAQYAKEVQG